MAIPHCFKIAAILALACVAAPALRAVEIEPPKFTAAQSCMSSSCHGGGVGKDQAIIWEKKDVHSRAHAILSTARSQRIADALKIDDPTKSARCNVCHSPMKALPPSRFVAGAHADNGVSCESCHGAAEPWLRFHTRTDVTHEQRVSAGLRELTDLYGRANACIACHMNIDAELVATGHHPEMFFELDGQMNAQPPHYKDDGTFVGPRAWLTGQAVALRELSWKLAKKRDDDLVPRWKAMIWLLRKTETASRDISESADFATVQNAADRAARAASRTKWTKEKTSKLLRDYVTLSADFRDSTAEVSELRRRAELLVLALDRLWVALKKDGEAKNETFDAGLKILTDLARAQSAFERAKFAAALEQLEVALERMPH